MFSIALSPRRAHHSRMARRTSDKAKREIRDKDITGLKYVEKLLPLFERLHEVGCERDTAGNRDLHFDQYCCLVLLFFFNPIVDSLRALQQASALKSVQKKLGVPRASSMTNARRSNVCWNATGCMSWTAVMPSSRCSTPS
jgi:hypothetical protein